ncbi:uncharacterized protein [Coffea arabica]|uniref:Reverse transcriptase domain-containing protein n=1 Tax=Coffea arabica TaxID=13443 RepID=A0ABM4V3H8_COFAR
MAKEVDGITDDAKMEDRSKLRKHAQMVNSNRQLKEDGRIDTRKLEECNKKKSQLMEVAKREEEREHISLTRNVLWQIWKNGNEIHFNGMKKNPIIPSNKAVNQWNEHRQAQEREKKESDRQRESDRELDGMQWPEEQMSKSFLVGQSQKRGLTLFHGVLGGGDFNVILAPHERCGGQPFGVHERVELMPFMEAAGIFDVGFSGANFTWCNNRRGRAKIWKYLDRLIINGECAEVSPIISVEHLARHPSDHAPLRISFSTRLDNKSRPFLFLNVWTSKAALLEVVRSAWDRQVNGAPLHVLYLKLMATRQAIQVWNKQAFGNVFDVVREAEAAVQRAEMEWEGNDSEEAQEVVKQRRVQSTIHRIKNSQCSWVEKEEDIASEAIQFFSNLFSEHSAPAPDMLHLIPPLITVEDNETLEAIPSMEKVRRVVFAMDGESAAGPDGFTGKFFTFSWDIIARDIYNVVFSFFCGAELPKLVTSTSVVLIPKARGLRQGDPLSSALFVIGSEVLSRGLNNLAVQLGFVGFRVPHECPSITHLAFADDVFIFANDSSSSLQRVMLVLELYQQSSAQLVNAQKSGYLVHPSMPPSRRRVIERITKFARRSFLTRYLGFPLYLSRCRSSFFEEVSQAVLERVL